LHRFDSRVFLVALWVVIITIIATLATVVYYNKKDSFSRNTPPTKTSVQYPKPRHEIRGLHFSANVHGRTVLCIDADRFTIEKKKIGFFRFGLVNEARFQNAQIKLFANPRSASSTTLHEVSFSKHTQSDIMTSTRPTFAGAVTQTALPEMPVKRIGNLVCRPVKIDLYEGDMLTSQIKADTAEVGLRERTIIFTGHVRVVSGKNRLATERLIFFPETGLLRTDTTFVLQREGRPTRGSNLLVDILLNPMDLYKKNGSRSEYLLTEQRNEEGK